MTTKNTHKNDFEKLLVVTDQPAPVEEKNYFLQRCELIGLTPDNNKLTVKKHPAMPNSEVFEYPLLEEDKKTGDILIPLYDLKATPINYYKDNPGKLANGKEKIFYVRRYKPGNERKMPDGGTIKYETPKGAKTLPWISPNIIEAYRNKTTVNTLVITEGYIKAISGYLNGLHIFGLSGIQNAKDKDTQTLHPDILEAIKTLQAKNIVLLYDGDCNAISLKAIDENKDLRQRPYGFFASARNIVELLKDYRDKLEFDIYFAFVNSESIEGSPKGLDDLFTLEPENSAAICTELQTFSKQKNNYFQKINITYSLTKVYNLLHIQTPETFYTAHNQIIKEKEFIYGGTRFKFDTVKNELKVIIPGAARNYFRVGDNYFEKLKIPNKHGILEQHYHRRLKGTIVSDYGAKFVEHIPKYKAFCVKPDHVNYQEIIDNCYNRYKVFEHEIDESLGSDCPITLDFLKHIFGEQYELGLDYIQLLYQKPTQMLPIVCLVSKENNTGKSTFGKLLKAIYTGNMAFIGNADLESDFNAGWADKLLICCEESFIDKKKTIEKIKALSTGDKIQINQKGVDQVEIDFFGKFIFMSNNEENFIIANDYDQRFWVRRIAPAKNDDTALLDKMIEEIQAFLNFLNRRTLSKPKSSRMWFSPEDLKTDALKKLVQANKPQAETEVYNFIKNFMIENGFKRLEYTLKYISETILRRRYNTTYVERILKENLKLKTTGKAQRYTYYEHQRQFIDGKPQDNIVGITSTGRPFVFEAEHFLTPTEITGLALCEAAKSDGQDQQALAF